jgi:hypothetical protein
MHVDAFPLLSLGKPDREALRTFVNEASVTAPVIAMKSSHEAT